MPVSSASHVISKVLNEFHRIEKHRCRSGECIDPEKACDGSFDCLDSSDEEESLCLKSFCPKFAFRCRYGACVPKTSRCNGVIECVDNSDEDERLCGENRAVPMTETNITSGVLQGSCRLPKRNDLRFISIIFQVQENFMFHPIHVYNI